MANLLVNLIYSLSAELGSVVSHIQNYLGAWQVFDLLKTFFTNGFAAFENFQSGVIWSVEKFVLGILDAFEFAVTSFLGVGTTVDDYVGFAEKTNIMSTFVKTFKAICVVALILMIIFTIFAIIRQEYANATSANGMSPDKNNKGPIVMRLFRGLMSIVVLPIAVIIIIGGVNSILTSFNRALKGQYNSTIAANVLSTASYNSNKYRLYAERNQRVPITIQAYNADDYAPDEADELLYKIKSASVQNKLKATVEDLANSTFLSFKDSLTYSNNKLTNSSKYGDYYETFICTPEQYQVMADFVNFAELTQSNFYIRSIDDEFIEWKYVDSTLYSAEDNSLTITYRDASDLNDNGSTSDTYTITYTMSYDVSSPISDALESLKALLGLGEYSDNTYNEMERDENSINVVQWANKKVSIHFSKNFIRDNPQTWTATDEIIMYEYYHFSSNNTFSDYTIDDFSWENAVTNKDPVTLDAYVYSYRKYYPEADAYSPEIDVDCVLINGNYYITEVSEEEEDEYGNPYYVLKEIDDTNFLISTYTTIFVWEEVDEKDTDQKNVATIKLSDSFDLNDPQTWTYSDQIIMYEYYKDLSYNNELSKYPISKFKTGLKVPIYVISLHKDLTDVSGTAEFYAYINGTYYQLQKNNDEYVLYSPSDSKFLSAEIAENATYDTFYNYIIKLDSSYGENNGISTEAPGKTANDFIITSDAGTFYYYTNIETIEKDGKFEERATIIETDSLATALEIDDFDGYESFDLKFSSSFDYKDVGTWTYRDYFIFYLYTRYLSVSGVSLSQLTTSGGIRGEICRVGIASNVASGTTDIVLNTYEETESGWNVTTGTSGITEYMYLFRIDPNYTNENYNSEQSNNTIVYLKLDDVMNISELNVLNVLDIESSYVNNNFDKAYEDTLFIDINETTGSIEFGKAETEQKSFSFSSGFVYSSVDTWTVGDFILLYLHEQGIITIKVDDNAITGNNFYNKEEIFSAYTYNALVYKVKDLEESLKFYQFGTGTNKVFLSEEYIVGLSYNSIDTWWAANLISFLTRIYSTTDSSNIIVDSSTIANSIYTSKYSSYVYTSEDIITQLVNEYVFDIDNADFEIFDSIVTYTYYNSEFNLEDLSTWTVFDAIIYNLNGSVSKRNYNYSLAYKNSQIRDIVCLIIGDKAIELTSQNLQKLGLSINNNYVISSDLSTVANDVSENYNEDYNMVTSSNTEALTDYSLINRYTNLTFSYTFAGSNDSNLLTQFDLYLISLMNSGEYGDLAKTRFNATNSTYNFEVYVSNTSSSPTYYVKLFDIDDGTTLFYVTNIYSSNSYIEITGNSTISCSKKLFTPSTITVVDETTGETSTVNETYTSFSSEDSITLLDAYIYQTINSIEPITFQIYNMYNEDNGDYSGSQYLIVNNIIIEYNSEIKVSTKLNNDITSLTDDDGLNDIIKLLYDNVYNSLIIQNDNFDYSHLRAITLSEIQEINDFDINDITTWKPFTIILYNLGLLKEDGELDSVSSATLFIDGSNYYIRIAQSKNNTTATFSINISSILNIEGLTEDGSNEELLISTPSDLFTIMFVNILQNYKSEVFESTNTLNSKIYDSYMNGIVVDVNTLCTQDIPLSNSMSLSDISTWSWYGILYYYYFKTVPSDTTYITYAVYGDSNKNGYLLLSDGTNQHYVKINDNLFKTFNQENVDDNSLSFNLTSGSVTALEIINYAVTGNVNGSYLEFSLSNDSSKRIQFINSDTNIYVYNLLAEDASISNKTVAYLGENIDSKDVSDLTVFDVFVLSLAGVLSSSESNTVLEFDNKNYLYINNSYINLTKINVEIDTNTNSLKINEDSKIFSELGSFDLSNGAPTNAIINSAHDYENSKNYAILVVSDDILSNASTKAPTLNGMEQGSDSTTVQLKFSTGFDVSNYSTWKLSDFIIYYIFSQSTKNFDTSIKNFQYYVNLGYVPATFCNIKITDEVGNITSHNVLLIGQAIDDINELNNILNSNNSADEAKKDEILNYIYVDYNIFYNLFDKEFTNIMLLSYQTNDQPISIDLTGSSIDEPDQMQITNFSYKITSVIATEDFKFNNYYYYKTDSTAKNFIFSLLGINNISSIPDEAIDNSILINLKLSSDFILEDTSTWTILDYIIIYEYTKNIPNNIFEELSFSDLKNKDFYYELIRNGSEGTDYYLRINGTTYNITKLIEVTQGNELCDIRSEIVFTIDGVEYTIQNKINLTTNLEVNDGNIQVGGSDKYYETIKNANVLDADVGYSLRVLCKSHRYNIEVITSDLANEFENTRLSGKVYYSLKDLTSNETIFVLAEKYNTDLYPEDLFEIIDENATDLTTQEDYLKLYQDFGKPVIELIETATTLTYSADGKVNWVNPDNPQIINEYYQLINNSNNEIIFVLSSNFDLLYDRQGDSNICYRKDDQTVNYTILGEPSILSNSDNLTEESFRFYRNLDSNVYFNYQISLTRYTNYTISANVQKVNWPQKLINDMMVIYPDLNWSTLLATDGWIDTLGEYHSGIASGQYISSGNSANITAVGMVLSEFFLSVANESEGSNNYAEYEYDSIFDASTIKALMLSIMGEENYDTLVNEAQVFVDLFNTGFASILDDIADERNITIKDGKVDNLTMSIYKSFLATAILSSDFAEYLYTIATRVLSQYTIYEYLAKASGDYAKYYAYFNGQTDENGETVDSFTYSSFEELTWYENESLRDNAVPMFTFNIKSAWEYFNNKEGTLTYDKSLVNFDSLYTSLDKYYSSVYLDSGSSISDKDPLYCFLLDVYYSIRQTLKQSGSSQPTYLKLYKDYLDGKITRWNEVSDSSINGASVYFEKYSLYQASLQLNKAKVLVSYINNIINPLYSLDDLVGDAVDAAGSSIETEISAITGDLENVEESAEDIGNSLKDIIDGLTNVETVYTLLKKVFKNNPRYLDYTDNIFKLDNIFDFSSFQFVYSKSEKGSSEAWDLINQCYEEMGLVLSELSDVSYLEQGGTTSLGSVNPTDVREGYIDDAYDRLSEWYNNLGAYINTQNILDKTAKASVTFTLAQHANNYVEEGFAFTIQNKQYTIKTTVSTSRLGEYVYGGEYLEKFGIPASYTSSEFTGIVDISSAYDETTNSAKTKIASFTTLRSFASKLADYTGKLYLLSNMMDLSANDSDNESLGGVYNNQDSVLMTDYIYVKNPFKDINMNMFSTNAYIKTTQEYLILDYIVENEYLTYDTLRTLIVADNSETLNASGNDLLAKIGLGSTDYESMSDEDKNSALRYYLWYIQTSTVESSGDIYYGYNIGDYGYAGNYNTGSDSSSDRIHEIFKKVILYLTNSVEDNSNGLETDFEGTTISFENMYFQKLKTILMDALINFEKNEGDTGENNSKRYLTLFYLICSEFDYFYSKDNYETENVSEERETELGRTIARVNNTLIKSGTDVVGYVTYNESYYARAEFRRDLTTSGLVLRLAGLDNRPIEELVNRQYDDLYNKNGVYDEANGDTFILCTYNEEEGKYYPILARNDNYAVTDKYLEYIRQDYGVDLKTDYYDSAHAYPIIAKGILTGNDTELLPTAIRMVNGEITYYRDNIIATTSLDESSISSGSIVSEVSTVNYVSYVPYSTFSNYGDTWTMYISANNPSLYLNSDFQVYYVQFTNVYNLGMYDEYGAVSVLDQFTSFYNMDVVFHLLMFLGFVTMIPILFKALLVAMRRILDLMALVLIGPLAISMNSLQIDESNSQAYNTWKDMFTKSLLSVFGIVVSFNLYYILVNTALNMTYVQDGDATMQIIAESPVSWLSTGFINGIITFFFVIIASQMIQQAANMIGKIVTGGRVENSFASALDNKEPIVAMTQMVKGVVKDVRNAAGFVGKIYTGELLIEAKAAAIEAAKEAVPGSAIFRRINQTAHNIGINGKARKMSKMAQKNGNMSKAQADKYARQFAENAKKIRKAKFEKNMKRANAFNRTFGLDEFNSGVKYKDPKKKKLGMKDSLNNAEEKLKKGFKGFSSGVKAEAEKSRDKKAQKSNDKKAKIDEEESKDKKEDTKDKQADTKDKKEDSKENAKEKIGFGNYLKGTVKFVAKKTGQAVAKRVKKVGENVKYAAKSIYGGMKKVVTAPVRAVKAVARAPKNAFKAVKRASGNVAEKFMTGGALMRRRDREAASEAKEQEKQRQKQEKKAQGKSQKK